MQQPQEQEEQEEEQQQEEQEQQQEEQEQQQEEQEQQQEEQEQQEGAVCSQDGRVPIQERGDPPEGTDSPRPPWALLPTPSVPSDPHMADPLCGSYSSEGGQAQSCPSELKKYQQKLKLASHQIQMLIMDNIKLEQNLKLWKRQNTILLEKQEKFEAMNKHSLRENEKLTERAEQLEAEKEQLRRERDQAQEENAQLRQQVQAGPSGQQRLTYGHRLGDSGQKTAMEEEDGPLSTTSSVSVCLHSPAFTPMPLQSPDAHGSLQTALAVSQTLQTAAGDSSTTTAKSQQQQQKQEGGVKRSRQTMPPSKRRFTLEHKSHLECAACHRCFDSELAATQSSCAYHQKQAMKVPPSFWTQSQRSPGSMGSSQQGQQRAAMPQVAFWPCCLQTGFRAPPCCKSHLHKLVSLQEET